MVATAKGEALRGQVFRHPLYDLPADVNVAGNEYSYKRLSPLYLADYVSDGDGTGIVHSSPAYGVDDFNSCVAHGLKYDEILNPVQGNGQYETELALFGGLNIWKACPVIIETLQHNGRLLATLHWGGKVHVWDLPQGRRRAGFTQPLAGTRQEGIVDFSPDGRWIAYAKRLTRAALDRPIAAGLADERRAFLEVMQTASAREGLARGRQPVEIQSV